MADIAKVKLPGDNTEYNIKDATARGNFANYLPLAGGSVTGNLSVGGSTTLNTIKTTSGVSYMTATDFANSPPSGTVGQVLFVIQGV